MKNHSFAAAFLISVCFSATAAAQAPSFPAAADFTVSAAGVHDSTPSWLYGWIASVSGRTSEHLRVVAELSHHTNQQTTQSFSTTIDSRHSETGVAAGPRFSRDTGGRSLPFAQVLLGINHRNSTTTVRSVSTSSSDTTWLIQPEIGLDLRLSDHWAARTQLGWRYLMTKQKYLNEIRVAAGLTLLLGK